MSTNIKLKKSSIAGRIPSTSDLDYGELAINYADGKLFYKNSSNQIKSFIDSAVVQTLIDNVSTGGGGTDSASVISLILSTVDSDYIALREADVNRGLDSAAVLNLIPAGTYKGIIQSSYTATAGQASFSADYTVGQVLVYLNGLLLSPDDYIATNGTSVSLVVNADSGDEIRIVDIIAGGIDSSASLDLIESTIDSAYVAARGLKYTDFSVSVQAAGSPNLSFNNTNGVFSYTPPNLSSYVTTTSLPSYGYTTYDSADTLGLVDSDYVQSKFTTLSESDGTLIVSGNILPDLDSTYSIGSETKKFKDIYLSGGTVYIDDLGLSANANGTITIGQLDSIGVLNSIGVIATVDSEQVGTIVDSAYLAARLTNYATQSYVTTQINNLIGGAPTTLDTLNEIAAALNDDDSAYATLVNLIGTKTDFDSADAIALITANDQQRDSAFITNIVDSAYIAARTSAGTDSASVISLITLTVDSAYVALREANADGGSGLDSTGVINLIDSDYIQARQSAVGSGGLDSAAVLNIFPDGTYRGLRTYEFTADSGQTTFTGADDRGNTLVYSNQNLILFLNGILLVDSTDYTATNGSSIVLTTNADSGDTVTAFNIVAGGQADSAAIRNEVLSFVDSDYIAARVTAGIDSATVVTIVQDTVDSSYVQARQTAQDFAYSSLTGAPTVLDSNNITSIVDSSYIQARQTTYLNVSEFINDANYLDSTTVTGVIDATYVQANQITYNTSDFVDSAFVTAQINALIDGAPTTLDTLNEIAAALNDDDSAYATLVTLIGTKTDFDSADATALITSYGYSTYDSTNTLGLVDSAYVQARQTPQDFAYSSLIGTPNVLDSADVNAIIYDSTFFVDRTNDRIGIGTLSPAYQVEIENTGANALLVLDRTDGAACFIEGQATRSAFGSVNATPLALAYNSAAVVTIGANGAITVNPDGANPFTFPTSDGTNGQVLTTDGAGSLSFQNASGNIDSAGVVSLIDSAYVQARQTPQDFAYSSLTGAPTTLSSFTNDTNYLDSTTVTGVIDAAYIQANQTTYDFLDSAEAIALIATQGYLTDALDSVEVISLVDSAYIQARQTAQDFAYSSLTGAPTNVSSFTNDVGYTTYDSSNFSQQITAGSYATQTYVTTSVDSAIDALVNGAPLALDTLNELATALQNDSDALAALTLVVDTKLNTAGVTSLVDSAYVQARQILQDFAYSSLTGAPTTVSSFTNDANYLDSTTVQGVIDATYIQANQTTYDFLDSAEAIALIATQGYLTDAIDSARITSMLAADSFSIGGTIIGDGKIEIRNGTGSTPSYVDLYCEVSNAHYTRIQSEAHANYSGNVTLTTPITSGTLALTSDIVDSAAIIALITANDQQRDSSFVTGIIDSAYVSARVNAVSGTDSAATIALIEATVDSAYVALREANAGVSGGGGGLDSAAVIALIDLNGGGNNNLVFTTYDYIATANQSTFSGNDKDGNGLTYNSGSVQVYRNGILLVETDDYTASNGSSIILNTSADSGDYISIATFEASISSIGISSYEFVADSGQTTFSGTATNGDVLGYTAGNLLVHLNGILLTDSDDYTATSGTSIVLGVAADSADLLHITTFAASSRSQWGATSASITAVSNKKYIVDTSSAITITLPSSPNFGDEIGVVDGTGNAGTNNITISSSNKILASDSDLTLDINRSGVTLTYYNSAQGWIITSTV